MADHHTSFSKMVLLLHDSTVSTPSSIYDQPGDRLSMIVDALSGDLDTSVPVPEFLNQEQNQYFSKKREEMAAYLRATTGSDVFNTEDFAGTELAVYCRYVQGRIAKPKK